MENCRRAEGNRNLFEQNCGTEFCVVCVVGSSMLPWIQFVFILVSIACQISAALPSSPSVSPSVVPTIIEYEAQSDDSQPYHVLTVGAIAGIAVGGFCSSILLGWGCYRTLMRMSDKDPKPVTNKVVVTHPQTPHEV